MSLREETLATTVPYCPACREGGAGGANQQGFQAGFPEEVMMSLIKASRKRQPSG